MKRIKIEGGHNLTGSIKISGAKNSAVALIPASLLSDGIVKIDNVPNISDIEALDEYKEQRTEIVTQAQNTAKEEIENSRIELENVSNEVKQSLKGSMTDLANDIVEKVIGYRSEVQGFDGRTVDEILYN